MTAAFQQDAFQSDAFEAAPALTGALDLSSSATLVANASVLLGVGWAPSSSSTLAGTVGEDIELAFQPGAFQADAFQTEALVAAVDGAVAWSASGSLAGTGVLRLASAWAPVGAASIALAGDIVNTLGEAAWTGVGLFSPWPFTTVSTGATWTGTGTIEAFGVQLGDAQLLLTGTISGLANGQLLVNSGLALSGTGTLGGAGDTGGVVLDGAATLAGAGAFAGSPGAIGWTSGLELVADATTFAAMGLVEVPTGYEEPYASYLAQLPRNIVIRVNGIDVTAIVRYRDAQFQSQVNGSPAPCQFAVRDKAHTQGFTTGHTITVDVDGVRRWSGYVTKVRRQYSAAVVDTTDYELTARWFLIEGLDVNLLLSKRIVWRKSNPVEGRLSPHPAWRDPKHSDQWIAGTPADVIVRYVLRHYTDLLDDDVDLSGVTMSDSPNPDFGGAFTGAMTAGDFLRSVNRLLGGIFYLTPTKRLMYHPVDTATTEYILTDSPKYSASSLAPQDFEVLSDAGAMANDALVWGTAPGVKTVTFKRVRDTTEIARHGLWQYGEFLETMYKPASVQKRADSIVYGNVASRLGAHYDRVSAEATVYAPVLFLGDVVPVSQEMFDGEQEPPLDELGDEGPTYIHLPVRRMMLTFPTPTSTRWQLLLTQELDEPWNIYESRWPPIGGYGPSKGPIDGYLPPPGGEGTCVTSDYNLDEFERTTSTAGGPFPATSSAWGSPWVNDGDQVTGALAFPGESVERPDAPGSGNLMNKLTPAIPRNSTNFYADIVAHDPGSMAMGSHGIIASDGTNIWRPATTGPYGPLSASTGVEGSFFYYFWGGSPSVYNAGLTGSGTYTYQPGSFGGTVTTTAVAGGVVNVSARSGYYAARLPYKSGAPWNKDVVRGIFRFKFNYVPTGSPASIEFTYGAATARIVPSVDAGSVAIVTGSGSSSVASNTWLADNWYICEVDLDLPKNEATIRLYVEGSADRIEASRATNGERVADASYKPYVRVRVGSTSATPFLFNMTPIGTQAYYVPADAVTEGFTGSVPPNNDGWGTPWVVYDSAGAAAPDPNLEWQVNNGIGSVAGVTGLSHGWTERPLPADAGDAEVWFQVADYPTGQEFMSVFFNRSSASKSNMVAFGPDMTVFVGTGSGSTESADTASIFNGEPVNVHIRWSRPTMTVWAWRTGDEPATPTLQHTKTFPAAETGVPVFAIWPSLSVGQGFSISGIGGRPMTVATNPVAMTTQALQQVEPGQMLPDGFGLRKSWPFSAPADGRIYPTSFGSDVYIFTNVSVPSYTAVLVWAHSTPPTPDGLGPGVPESLIQDVASIKLPKYTVNGQDITLFDVVIQGEFGMAFSGQSSGTGEATATAVFKSYTYGLGPIKPAVSDYFITSGMSEMVITQDVLEGGEIQYQPFLLRLVAPESNGGVTNDSSGFPHVQWGFEILDAHATIRGAGPFNENGFLTVNKGTLGGYFRNLTYELVPRGVPVIGIPEACLPFGGNPLPSAPTSGEGEQTFSTGALVYELGTAYVPGSVAVWVGGSFVGSRRLLPLVDYSESNYLRGLVTLMTPPTGPVHITWQVLGLVVPDA